MTRESDPSWEGRSAARRREEAQWGELRDRVAPYTGDQGDSYDATMASRIASEAGRTYRGQPYQPAPEDVSESPLAFLGRMLRASAETFRDVVPQEARDVLGGIGNTLTSGERFLDTAAQYDPARAIGNAVGDYVSGGESTRYQQQHGLDKPGTYIGETLDAVPGVGHLARTAFDVGLAPTTLATAGVGGELAGAARASKALPIRLLGNLASPIAPEGVGLGGRLAAETAAGVGGSLGAEYAGQKAEEYGLPAPARIAISLLGGVVGGVGGAGLAGAGRAVVRNGVRPTFPNLADEAGSMKFYPEDFKDTVTLHRGDATRIENLSMSKASRDSLLGRGIYFTEDQGVASTYQAKGAQKLGQATIDLRQVENGSFGQGATLEDAAKQHFYQAQANQLGGAISRIDERGWDNADLPSTMTREEVQGAIDRLKEAKAAATSAKDDPSYFPVRQRILEEYAREQRPPESLRVVKLGEPGNGWGQNVLIQDAAQESGSMTSIQVPKAILDRTIRADDPLTPEVRSALKRVYDAYQAGDIPGIPPTGDPAKAETFHYALSLEDTTPAEALSWLNRAAEASAGLDSKWPLKVYEQRKDALQTYVRRLLGDQGYTGFHYEGGRRLAGAGSPQHNAYALWDEQGIQKLVRGEQARWKPRGMPGAGDMGSVDEYQGFHAPPGPEDGAPLSDLTGGGRIYPDDVYTPEGRRYYGTGEPLQDRAIHSLALKVRNNPDAMVTVYRAVPANVEDRINPGDWVTPIKAYAAGHGERFEGGTRILEETVRAGDLYTNGDSWMEYGWHPRVGGGAGEGGVAPGPALSSMFGVQEPPQGLTRMQQWRNVIKETLGQPAGLVVDDPITTPATQMLQRWEQQADSVATIEADQAKQVIDAAGFQFGKDWTIPALAGKGSVPGAPTLQDVAARLPEYAMSMTPEQTQAIERLGAMTAKYDPVVRETLGDVGSRADVMPGGYYLHRGFEPQPEVRISVGGATGGRAGFEKEAAYSSMAEAIAAGKTPLAPWDSMREYVADVGKRGARKYYSEYLKSVQDEVGGKFALTSADRIDPQLRQTVDQLRNRVSDARQRMMAQTIRAKGAEGELGRAERASQQAGARTVEAMGRRAMLPDVTPEDLAAARSAVTDAITESRQLTREIADHAAKLKATTNGLNAQERAIVKAAEELDASLGHADAIANAAERLVSETRVSDQLRTPDTTVARLVEEGMPSKETLASRIEAIRGQVQYGSDFYPLDNAPNKLRMQELGELQALDDIRWAMGESGTWDDAALADLERTLEDLSNMLTMRDSASMRARVRNDANRRGAGKGDAKGMFGTSTLGGDDEIETLRARAALLFRVWDSGSLEVPVPQVTNAIDSNATRAAVARAEANLKKAGGQALNREHRLLLRQADGLETKIRTLTDGAERMAARVDAATERGAILSDLDQAARQQLTESRRYERAMQSGDRRIAQADREIRLLQSAERRYGRVEQAASTRAENANLRLGETGQTLADSQAALDSVKGDWEHAKAIARQTPQGRSAIGLAELQGSDFPLVAANAANRILQSEAPTTGRMASTIKAIGAVNNLLRGVRATADVSFMGIQGGIGLANDPKAYAKALGAAYQGAFSDPNARAALRASFDQDNAARGLLTSAEMAAGGLHQGASSTEFSLRSSALDRAAQLRVVGKPAQAVQGIANSANEAFGTFGDMLRLYHASNLMQRALAKGDIDASAIARFKQGMQDSRITAILNHANLTTGWSPSKFAGEYGELLQFAPRFFQSQLDLAFNGMTKGGMEGKLARRELLQYLGLAMGATTLINLGINGKVPEINPLDPENGSNFMRIRAGGHDYSLLGPWDSLMRGVIAAAHGDPGYLARSKASPTVAMAWDLLSGKDFTGAPVEAGPNQDFAGWLLRQVTPFSTQDFPALAHEALSGNPGGAAGALAANLAGIKSSPMTPNEELNAIAQKSIGVNFWDAEPYQREAIKQANPDVWERSVARGSEARQRAEVVRSDYYRKQETADSDLLAGGITRQQWRDGRADRRIEQRAKLEEIYGNSSDRSKKPRNAYERYLAIIDAHVDPKSGNPDWEAVDAELAQLPAKDQEEIDKSVGVGQTPLSREFAVLGKEYAKLPMYVGYSADDGRKIDALWTEVRNSSETSLGQLRAIGKLQDEGVNENVLKGLRQRALGNTLKEAPDRKRFKDEHPRYKVLTTNGKLTERDRAILADQGEAVAS